MMRPGILDVNVLSPFHHTRVIPDCILNIYPYMRVKLLLFHRNFAFAAEVITKKNNCLPQFSLIMMILNAGIKIFI